MTPGGLVTLGDEIMAILGVKVVGPCKARMRIPAKRDRIT
jgi:hypothetical protein